MNSLDIFLIDTSGSMRGSRIDVMPDGTQVDMNKEIEAYNNAQTKAGSRNYIYRYQDLLNRTGRGHINANDIKPVMAELETSITDDPDRAYATQPKKDHVGWIQQATINGFNKFLQLQQLRLDNCYVYMAQFAGGYRETHHFVPIGKVAPLSPRTYSANWSGTKVYDAGMRAILDAEKFIASLPEDERPRNVTFMLQTDGQDVGSLTRPEAFKQKMEQKKREGWQFVFLATDTTSDHSDVATRTAEIMGFDPAWTLSYDASEGSEQAFEETATAIMESLIAPGAVHGLHGEA